MRDIKQTVMTDIINLMISRSLSKQEEVVLALLTERWGDREISQKEIALSSKWKDSHPLLQDETNINTTTRKLRKVIRNLRIEHKLPILHNERGHFLPETEEDIDLFMERLELEAKSRAASTIETYKAMKDTFGVFSSTLDSFDTLGTQMVVMTNA